MRITGLVFAMLALLGCSKPSWHMTDISGAMPRLDFHMTSEGKPVSAQDYRGKVVALYFGYTHCPDVCPATMANLTDMLAKVNNPDVQILFVTVDPDRDTSELLASYVTAFDPSFVALRGDADAIARTAKEFKILYQKQPGRTPESYTVDHSAGTFVFDPQGRLRLYVGNGQGSEVFAHDIRELLHAQG